jgi:hypothetical protein
MWRVARKKAKKRGKTEKREKRKKKGKTSLAPSTLRQTFKPDYI